MDTQQRRDQEKQARKNDILEAALKLFSEKDFHEVTVDEIAERVGLSKGTLYLYFENKEDLFFTLVQEKTTHLLDRLKAAIECGISFNDCLERYIHTYLSFFDEYKSFFKIIHSEKSRMTTDGHHKFHEYGVQIFHKFINTTIDMIKMGQKQHVVRKMDPIGIAKTLRGILNSYTLQRVFWSSDLTIDQESEQILDLFLNGVKA